jgi:hypothetical protein
MPEILLSYPHETLMPGDFKATVRTGLERHREKITNSDHA